MTNRILVATIFLFALCNYAFADYCDLGDVYVGDPEHVEDWVGSVENAAAMPGVWMKEDRIQIGRKYTKPLGGKDLYIIAELIADQEVSQGMHIVSGRIQVRVKHPPPEAVALE
jgi:hypothetical protein